MLTEAIKPEAGTAASKVLTAAKARTSAPAGTAGSRAVRGAEDSSEDGIAPGIGTSHTIADIYHQHAQGVEEAPEWQP